PGSRHEWLERLLRAHAFVHPGRVATNEALRHRRRRQTGGGDFHLFEEQRGHREPVRVLPMAACRIGRKIIGGATPLVPQEIAYRVVVFGSIEATDDPPSGIPADPTGGRGAAPILGLRPTAIHRSAGPGGAPVLDGAYAGAAGQDDQTENSSKRSHG